MTIHKEGKGTILTVWLIAFSVLGLSIAFISNLFILCPIAAICIFFICFILFFFRVPERTTVEGTNVVTSVADGEVVIVDKVTDSEYFKGECIQVSVYMSFFNVHVNYWPIDGEVTYYKYHPGRYMLAFLPKASELNEHSSMAIRSKHGDVFFKQLAGTFARRIVTYAPIGAFKVKGSQCGIIKFGSRIDMYLPLGTDIKVKVGDKVKACESVIAELRK